MTKTMIGIHRLWNGEVIPVTMRDRFARSLGIAGPRQAETCVVADTLAAATNTMRGWKPQLAPDGSHVLFAGRIDNRRQLAEELGVSADNLEQIYAHGLATWGDDIDLRAIGQFATIVISPDGGEIRLSRSPLAAPPLHIWHDADRCMVTTLIGALFSTGEVEKKVDDQKVEDILFANDFDVDRAFLAGVKKLRCGHRARVSRNRIDVEKYYDVADLPLVRLGSDQDYVDAALALLKEGVEAALDGASRPAISLSGGFDSQAVAALVMQCRPGQPLYAYTSVPEKGWDCVEPDFTFGNERPHVEALVAMYPQIRPHWVDAEGLFFEHKLEAMFTLSGVPADIGGGLHWSHECFAQARADGCDLMLSGGAGNGTVSFDGTGALPAMLRHGRLRRLWKEAGFISRRRGVSRFRVLISQAILPFTPNWFYELLGRLGLIRIDDPFGTWCPLNRNYAKEKGVEDRAKRLGYVFHPRGARSSRVWRDEIFGGPADTEGACVAQAMELLHGIEVRDPTGYRPLVEFCLGIPDEQYLKDGVTRRLARRMLKGLIPDMVLDEQRIGFQVADWHLRLGRIRHDLIAEIDRLAEDDRMAEMLNLADFRRRLVDWHEVHRPEDISPLGFGIVRAIMTARYVRHVEGSNA